jgi:hypothetical protein
MEEVPQMIFGGYGTILDHSWLEQNPFCAQIFVKQESDKKGTQLLDPEVLYKADGLHVLYGFHKSKKIRETLAWMLERLVFAWVEVPDKASIAPLELEMHSYVTTNILGTRGRVNFPHNNVFSSIDWTDNMALKEWLEEVKSRSGIKS